MAKTMKQTFVDPLMRYVADVRKETGTRPTIEMYIHSAAYDELVAELAQEGTVPGEDVPTGREGMSFAGYLDLVVRPERARSK